MPLRPRRCAHCDTDFQPRRRTARFCSARCRVAAHRAVRRVLDPPPVRVRLTVDELYLLRDGVGLLVDAGQQDAQALFDRLGALLDAMD